MAYYILKPDRDVDLYVEWSTIVESVTAIGTRQEFLNEGTDAARLDRVDRVGSSALGPPGIYGYDDEALTAEQRILPREHLATYVVAVMEGRDGDARVLTEAFED